MKTCRKCKAQKELTEFFNDPSGKDGKRASCKACVYAVRSRPIEVLPPTGFKKCRGCSTVKEYSEFWLDAANKTDGRYSHCKECKTAITYKWRENNKARYNKICQLANRRRYPTSRLQRYGLTDQWFKETLAAQDNKCAICRKPNPSKKRCFAVDHEHSTGRIRGILCYNCNRLLHAFDNIDLYNKIMDYLKKYKEIAA